MLVASEIQQRYRISYWDAFHDPAQVGRYTSAHLGEFQMCDKRLEVFIGKQQRQAMLNAERGNNDIGYLANGDAFSEKYSEVLGALDRHSLAEHIECGQLLHQGSRNPVVPV